MTETPQGRRRRTERNARPEDITPQTRTRTPQARAPIGRSPELMERQARMRQPMPTQRPDYSDFDDYSARAARPARKTKRRRKHNGLWFMVAFICLMATGVLVMFAAPQWLGITYADMPNYAFVNQCILRMDSDAVATQEAYRQYLQTDRIYSGVYIDGVHVGGMTKQEAREAVSQVDSRMYLFD